MKKLKNKETNSNTRMISLRLENDLYDALMKETKKEYLKMSALAKQILAKHLRDKGYPLTAIF